MMDRLQKIVSRAGVASRRAAERLMLEGRVTVNGVTARELGTKADAARDDIRVDGRRISLPESHRYILLNKPRGYVTTRIDPERRPTVLDLLRGVREYVYPVGRLDFDSEGLLLLTNDGDLAAMLTNPRSRVPRVYEAHVAGVPDARDLDRLARGLVIDGRRTGAAEVLLASRRPSQRAGRVSRRHQQEDSDERKGHEGTHRQAMLRITIREGRNRQVRKMCEAIGHPVSRLQRVAFGPIRDSRLKPGQWRELTPEEVARLRAAVRH